MRGLLIAIILGVAVMTWLLLYRPGGRSQEDFVRERFDARTAPATPSAPATPPPTSAVLPPATALQAPAAPTATAPSSDGATAAFVMGAYNDLFGSYPPTAVLMHYVGLSASLTNPEIKARMAADGQAGPPGLTTPSPQAEAQIASMGATSSSPQPILPASLNGSAATAALPTRVMNIAMQLSQLSQELGAAQSLAPTTPATPTAVVPAPPTPMLPSAGGPKAYESFMSFR